MKTVLLLDIHTHANIIWCTGRYINVIPTGRIKYRKAHDNCKLYVEVSFRERVRIEPKHWWNKATYEWVERVQWASEYSLILKYIAEEVIYECSAKSDSTGD